KTYLWGGLYEINHEYSPMEALDGVENSPSEHYFKFDPQGFAYDPDRAAFLARLAALRTGPANRYLAYGVMLRPPDVQPSDTRMSWFHYNSNQKTREYRDRGSIVVPGIIASAWQQGTGPSLSFAFLFANTEGKEVTVQATVDRKRYGITGDGWKMRILSGFDKGRTATSRETGPLGADPTVALSLPLASRDLLMVEFHRE
ncbi:MAG TPA: hypothetical protein VFH83_07575, partial [Spirochaetia bacterium]|nr:hypothetical protein [Spirochaetia bacterium]